jgi:hypothetical protein
MFIFGYGMDMVFVTNEETIVCRLMLYVSPLPIPVPSPTRACLLLPWGKLAVSPGLTVVSSTLLQFPFYLAEIFSNQVLSSVADSDTQISASFCRIRIRNIKI